MSFAQACQSGQHARVNRFRLLLLTLAAACSRRDLQQDATRACQTDSDCLTGQICASDRTCWTVPPLPVAGGASLAVSEQNGAVRLTWIPIAHAVRYQLLRGIDAAATDLLATTEPTGQPREEFLDGKVTPGHVYHYRLQALFAPVGQSDPSPEVSASLHVQPLDLVADPGIRHVTLTFTPSSPMLGTALTLLSSNAEGGPYLPAGLSGEAMANGALKYQQFQLADDQTVFYRLQAADSRGSWQGAAIGVTTAAAPPAKVTASCEGGARVSWSPNTSAGITGYTVWRADKVQVVATVGPDVTSVPDPGFVPSQGSYYRVTSLRGALAGDPSETAYLESFPPLVADLTATAAIDRIDLSWRPYPGALHYTVNRWDDVSVQVAATAYTDLQVLPFKSYGYYVQAVTMCSLPAKNFSVIFPVASGPADVDNPGGAAPVTQLAIDSGHRVGQTFTPGSSGRLVAVEASVGTTGSSAPFVNASVFSGGVLLATSAPVRIDRSAAVLSTLGAPGSGTIFSFGSGLPVQQGEPLTIVLQGTALSAAGAVADSYPGGVLRAGPHDDPARDLVFRTYLAPDLPSTFSLPPPLAGLTQVALAWPAPTGATSYEVRRDGALIGEPSLPLFLDSGLDPHSTPTYEVRALGPGLSLDAQNQRAVILPGLNPDQMNPGDGGAALPVAAGHAVAQTVTPSRSGFLTAVEVAALWGDTLRNALPAGAFATLRVLDSGGNLLASQPIAWQLDGCCSPPPLTEAGLSISTAILGGAGIAVVEGQSYQLELDTAVPLQFLDTADVYPGGSEWVDGVAVPDRDLAFRIFVQ